MTEQERYTPNQLAVDAEALLARLIAERDAESNQNKRKQLSSRVKSARLLRNWARTRARYRAA